MDDIKRKKAFLWDPHRSQMFALGLGGAVRLYGWDDSAQNVVPIGVRDNVGPLSGLAWSPHSRDPLLAAALSTGSLELINFRRPLVPRPGETSTSESYTLHPPRQARQTTALAFSRTDGGGLGTYGGGRHLLAQGFTKTRSDASVLVWDVTRLPQMAHSSQGMGVVDSFDAVEGSDRPKPYAQLLPSETVNDLAWLSPSLLAVATQRQPIRVFDVRAPSSGPSNTLQPVFQFGSHGTGLMTSGSNGGAQQTGPGAKIISLRLEADPFSSFRLASIDETPLFTPAAQSSAPSSIVAQAHYYSPSLREPRSGPSTSAAFIAGGVVRIWDSRWPREEVFGLAAAGEAGLGTPAMSVEWDSEREGRIGVLEKAGTVSVWDLWEAEGGESPRDEGRPLTLAGEPYRVPPPPPPAAYSTFLFPPRPAKESSTVPKIVAFSAKAGGEVLWPDFHQRQVSTFASDNSIVFTRPKATLLPPIAPAHPHPPKGSKSKHSRQRASMSSFHSSSEEEDEDATPAGGTIALPPTASNRTPTLDELRPAAESKVTGESTIPPRLVKASNVLAGDVSVLLKERAQLGYGVDPETNTEITQRMHDESLSFFWKWMQSWKTAFPTDHYSRYQFHLRGVQQLLDGLEPVSFNPTLLQARSRSPNTSGRSPSSSRDRSQQLSIADRRKAQSRSRAGLRTNSPSSDRNGLLGGSDPTDYKSACRKHVDALASDGKTVRISVPGGTKMTEERVCALNVLGWALSDEEIEERIESFEDSGDFEKAAFCGLFTGSVERALLSLEASGDERYLTMTLLIRSRLDNKGNKPPPEAYAFNTSRLISKLDSVEVRAICRFGLTGDWEEVLNEAGGSMIDTLALALKWAEDGSVRTYLREIRGAAMASGDLMGLALVGLSDSRDATALLQAYVDKTGDIQTVALIATQFWPSKRVKDQYDRWMSTYEGLLQKWGLHAARARIEQARGRLAREQNIPFRPPKEIIVRCAFCNKNVADLRAAASLTGMRGTSASICPGCHNGLPNCVVCRLSIARAPGDILGEGSSFDSDADFRPIYCLKCRHGGHRSPCLREWFSKENREDSSDEDGEDDEHSRGQACAEVGCDCRCTE